MKYFNKKKLEPYKNITGYLDGDDANQYLFRSTLLDSSNKLNSLTYTLEQYIIGIESSLANHISNDNVATNNFRSKGHREAFKFNLALQQTLSAVFKTHKTLKTQNGLIDPLDLSYSVSTSNISNIQHVKQQVKFHNWLKTKRPEDIWFN